MKHSIFILICSLSVALGQWTDDVVVNNVVESADGNQLNPLVTTVFDGATYIAWGDRRGTPDYDYRVVKFDFFGNRVEDYVVTGPHSSSVAGNIEALASDKDLGAYILWEQVNDSRDELRIQQLSTAVDANDGMVFEDGGLSVSNLECDRKNSSMYVIDRDNVIVSFTAPGCSGTDWGYGYVQKITNGVVQWGAGGKIAASRNTSGYSVLDTKLIEGPDNGAFILFSQNTTSDNSLRINYIDADGDAVEPLTYPSGLGLGDLHNKNNWEMDAAYDGNSGVFIVWRNSSNKLVYQHVKLNENNRLEATLAAPLEVYSCTASYVYPKVSLDNSQTAEKGLFIIFYDYDSTNNKYGLFGKYIEKPDGTLSDLYVISNNSSSPNYTGRMVHDIDGTLFEKEAFVTWLGSDGDLLARKIIANTNNQMDSSTPEIVVHDKSGVAGRNSPNGYDASHDRIGGLIVTWQQDRGNSLSADIFAQQIGSGGNLGINAQLIDEIDNVEIIEDEDPMIILGIHLTDVIRPFINILPQLSDDQVTASISEDTLRINFPDDWNGDLAVDIIADWIGFPIPSDTTSFSLSVAPTQDAPTAFDWVSSALDTINITEDNTEITYDLQWSESTDADGDTIDYLLYAQIGVYPADLIYDTTVTTLPLTYEEFLENVFEPFPMLSGVTVKFSVSATDGIDTVKVTGDDRVVYVNRYEYLSTESEGIPTEFALHENYPNPFNPTTTLRFDLPEVSDMTLTIYNMLGQKVRTFDYHNTSAGYHSVTWDATNDLGQQVGAGVYLYQLQTKDFVKTRKMVLLK